MAIFNTRYSVESLSIEWSPTMNSNNSPSPFVAEANSEYVSNSTGEIYYAYKAFDSNPATSWYSNAVSNRWLKFDAGKKMQVEAIKMLPESAQFDSKFFPKTITISGSNDGEKWTKIITDDGANYVPVKNVWRYIGFPEEVSYRHFKFDFGDAYNTYAQTIVGEIIFIRR